MRRASRTLCGTALVAVALAGCGGDDEQEPASGGGPEPAATQPAGGDAPMRAENTIESFEYMPATNTVAAGGSVTWTNVDSANHNVAFDSADAPEGINNIRQDESGSVTFDDPGTYAYICSFHPSMMGTVEVQ